MKLPKASATRHIDDDFIIEICERLDTIEASFSFFKKHLISATGTSATESNEQIEYLKADIEKYTEKENRSDAAQLTTGTNTTAEVPEANEQIDKLKASTENSTSVAAQLTKEKTAQERDISLEPHALPFTHKINLF